MAKPKLSSLIVFGVDIGDRRVAAEAGPVVRQLIQHFERHQIPATWTTEDVSSTAVSAVRASSVPHEIALAWNQPPSTRIADSFQFAAELRTQVDDARQAGVQLRSIAIDPRSKVPFHSLTRCGFTSLRPTRVRPTHQVTPSRIQSLRFGLWGVPVSYFWPHSSRLLQPFGLRQLLHHTRFASQAGQVLQIVIDVPTLVGAGNQLLASLPRLLELAATLRQQGQLHLGRLADVDRLARIEIVAQPAR